MLYPVCSFYTLNTIIYCSVHVDKMRSSVLNNEQIFPQLCQRWKHGCSFAFPIRPSISPMNIKPILVWSGPWSLSNQMTSWAGVEGGLKTVVLVRQVCLRWWKRSLRLIPSDFLVTRWAKLCLMNALMGSVYCEECRTGCPCGSRFDIITQICQGQRAPPLSALKNCLYHLHRHRYSDINVLLHGNRLISKPPPS